MILIFKNGTGARSLVSAAQEKLERMGLTCELIATQSAFLLVVLDDVSTVPTHIFNQLSGVEKVMRLTPQCSLAFRNGASRLKIGPVTIGGGNPIIIAGPCSVESSDHITKLAKAVRASGAHMLRGGAFKPRSSPYDFQGLGLDGLKYLAQARAESGLPVVSEIMSATQVEDAADYVDVFQIGARNMYNYDLLKEVGRCGRPVLLKRAMSATLNEFVSAAEYILLQGNLQVMLCERGIRTFETHTRNTLDLSAVAALKGMTPLPVLVDPSHGTGRRELVQPLSRAAIACGADGLLIEVHDQPNQAYSDGEQAITPDMLRSIADDAQRIYAVLHERTAFAHAGGIHAAPTGVS